MDPRQQRKTSHSIDSSRVSVTSSNVPFNSQTKRMQAKLLMDYYNQNQQLKSMKYRSQNNEKNNYGQFQLSLAQNQTMQQEAKKRRKQEIRLKLAQQYDEMIKFKQNKARSERQRVIQQEKKNLQISNWGRDNKTDLQRQKKMQEEYGKELEMHLRLQEIQKYEQKMKEKQMVQKYMKQQSQLNRSYDINQLNQFKKRQQFQKRQNEILGINNHSMTFGDTNPQVQAFVKSTQLQRSQIRALKRRQQLLYGSGLEHQLKSQTISPRKAQFNSQTQTMRTHDSNIFNSSTEAYNPITNPIQIKYKNPNVLRMLEQQRH